MKNFIIIFIVFICFSCHNDNEKIINISDVKKIKSDSIKVDFNVSSFYMKIKGYTNDTCYINKHKFKGQIDTVIKGDWYYNTYYLNYEPNKASEGEIRIEYGLY